VTLSTASAALEAVGDPYFVVDETGTLWEWNDTVPELTGVDDERLSEYAATDLFVDEDADRVAAGVETARASEQATIQGALRLADGRVCPYEFDLVGLEDGTVAALGWDISERRERRDAMQTRERVLRGMYDVISDTNRSFEEQVRALLMLGRNEIGVDYGTLSRIEGDDYVFDVVHAEDETVEAGDTVPLSETNCELVATEEQALALSDIETDAPEETDRDGYEEWGITCYLGAPVFVEGEVYGTFCFYDTEPRPASFSAWHVTLVDLMSRWVGYALQRQHDHEQLRRQNETLDSFASIVSHDLRNPLNVLQGSLELLEGDDENVHRAERAVERMETLIDDLLVLARAGTEIDDTETVDLAALVQQCWDGVDTADAQLVVETDRVIRADASRLRQLLENLIRNAVEHGSTGSQTQSADAVEHGGADREEPVTVTVGNSADSFSVADDGVGIDEADRETVFERGFSTRSGGTGFGLAIVAKIAEAHGWSVDLTESDEGGARFEFTGVEPGSGTESAGDVPAE
jgi:PAS domain S-box-containing protein